MLTALDVPDRRSGTATGEAAPSWRPLLVYHYYDQVARSLPAAPSRRQEIEESALGLRALIAAVLERTGAPRVVLVGHSTGGPIIRSLLQRTYPSCSEDPRDWS